MAAALREIEWDCTRREALDALRSDPERRAALTRVIAQAPFEALFWETPPFTPASLDAQFEFVLVDAPTLARVQPDARAFREHFDRVEAGESVCTFENLGGDAMLVVPCPLADDSAYPHLARFVREAPPAQVDRLWERVARAMEDRLARSSAPVWLSTSGLGVYWVHVRLDARPKYYTHAKYRRA